MIVLCSTIIVVLFSVIRYSVSNAIKVGSCIVHTDDRWFTEFTRDERYRGTEPEGLLNTRLHVLEIFELFYREDFIISQNVC